MMNGELSKKELIWFVSVKYVMKRENHSVPPLNSEGTHPYQNLVNILDPG